MPSIRATREEVSDRFPVLGFAVSTGGHPYFEVALATDPALFRADSQNRRQPGNFYSTRAVGLLRADSGSAMYLIPPEILARFIGQPRLYFALATYPVADASKAEVANQPGAASFWINMAGFTGRAVRRMIGVPNHRGGLTGNGYGKGGGTSLTWAGDTAQPGSEALAPAGQAPASAPNGKGETAGSSTASALNYDDGFSASLWEAPKESARPEARLIRDQPEAMDIASAVHSGKAKHADSVDGDGIDFPITDQETPASGQGLARPLADAPDYPGAAEFVPARWFRRTTGTRAVNRVVIHITDGTNKRAIATAKYFQDPQRDLKVDTEQGQLQLEESDGRLLRFRAGNRWHQSADGRIHERNGSTYGRARTQVSSHYVVGQDGEVIQCVHDNDTAFHASSANGDSIGIEHCASAKFNNPLSQAQVDASARLVCWLCDHYGIPKDREHISGHSEADPNTDHTDCPNAVWDWGEYMTLVNACGSAASEVQANASESAQSLAVIAGRTPNSRKLPDKGTLNTPARSQALSTDIPLDPGSGGRSITTNVLEIGDIILSTTPSSMSRLIRQATNSPVSHAMLYVGDGMVVEAIGEGVVMRTVNEALADASLAAAFRHPGLSVDQALMVRDFAGLQIGKPYSYWGIVRQAAFQLDKRTFCGNKSGDDYDACVQWAGTVNLGTEDNASFFCSQLVLDAYQAAGIQLTATPPHWNSPSDLAELRLNCTLSYLGHLRTPLAGSAGVGTAQEHISQVILPPPPESRKAPPARQQAVVEIAAAVAGTVMTRILENNGDVSWELEQLRGIKDPNDNQANRGTTAFQDATTVRLENWPFLENLASDQISAGFAVDWQYNGRSLGNVRITNTRTNDAIGWALVVKAQIMDDARVYGSPTYAALRVRFHYRFSRSIGPDVIAVTDLTLYGNGTFDQTGRWEQS